MGYKYKVGALLFALFILFMVMAAPLWAYQDPVHLISPRDAALGGRHAALSDSFSSLVNNPAGYYSSPEEVSIAELTLGLKGPVFSMADIITTGELTELADLINGIYTGIDLLGPLSFGYIGKGLGFGVFNQSSLRLSSDNSLTANVDVWDDIVMTGGYAYRLPFSGDIHKLDAGIMLKGGFRGAIDGGMSVVDIMDLNYNVLLNEPFSFTSFIGADLGLRYEWKDSWVVGLVGRDVYSPTLTTRYYNVTDFLEGAAPVPGGESTYDTMPFQLDIGMMYLPKADLGRYSISEIKLLLDYTDIFDFWLYPELSDNPILHVGLGAEITVMEILDVRLGLSQGLPAAGIGLDLHYFRLNASMFGTERSTEPGLAPVYNLQLGLEFRS
ncbi:MAG: hypothetical protein U5P10_10160 [Spirochaetia bacterium]|nr:hypothetical protein [Spirochaetia bacterium]